MSSIPNSNLRGHKRPSEVHLFGHIMRGGLLCLIFGVLDNLILHVGQHYRWTAWLSFPAFGLFVAQTLVLSTIVGSNVRKHWVWWLFFSWSLGLVNLQLALIQFESGEGYRNSNFMFFAFGFALFAAQIGLIIFWMICGTHPRARIRLPIAAIVLILACHPYWLLSGIYVRYSARQWMGLLTFFIVAAAPTFGILRYLRFQLVPTGESNLAGDQSERDAKGQFGIKHLFIWTTIVAVLLGAGSLVSWQTIFREIFDQRVFINAGRTLLITVSLVAVVWAVMGETKLIGVRVLVLLIFLSIVAMALYGLDYRSLKTRQNSLAIGYVWTRWGQGISWSDHFEMIKVWMIWTMLNGMFLASLLLVFRVAGFRFVKTAKRIR